MFQNLSAPMIVLMIKCGQSCLMIVILFLGITINQGLSALGHVITQLAAPGKNTFVAYRNSRLTRVLQGNIQLSVYLLSLYLSYFLLLSLYLSCSLSLSLAISLSLSLSLSLSRYLSIYLPLYLSPFLAVSRFKSIMITHQITNTNV